MFKSKPVNGHRYIIEKVDNRKPFQFFLCKSDKML